MALNEFSGDFPANDPIKVASAQIQGQRPIIQIRLINGNDTIVRFNMWVLPDSSETLDQKYKKYSMGGSSYIMENAAFNTICDILILRGTQEVWIETDSSNVSYNIDRADV